MGKYEDENVLVVKRALFDEIGAFEGFQSESRRYLESFLSPRNNYYLPRDDAEEDPSHKQLIPYSIFHYQGRLLHYVRGGASGEKRLASKGSIGIGGHINTTDEDASGLATETYLRGVEREIAEELQVGSNYTQQVVGLINDDSNEVGQVHLGVVHLFDLDGDKVASNEDAITELEFRSIEDLKANTENLETWSAILVENIDAILK